MYFRSASEIQQDFCDFAKNYVVKSNKHKLYQLDLVKELFSEITDSYRVNSY